MTSYREQILGVLRVASIRPDTRYGWLGRASRPLPPALAAELTAAERRRGLVDGLREELYWSFYSLGGPVPARWGVAGTPGADPALELALSRANVGVGSWDPGWTVERIAAGDVVVTDGRLRVRVPRDDCRGAIRHGGEVERRLAKELPGYSPGYYVAVGDAPLERSTDLRVYWNVAPAAAPELVRVLTSRLNAAGVPFRLKVADHPAGFARCDAAVLYLSGESLSEVPDAERLLRPGTPAFTLPLGTGLAAAEETPDGGSFGLDRCGLLAEGIVRAHEHRATRLGERLDVVAETFAERGIDIDAPYREPSRERHVL